VRASSVVLLPHAPSSVAVARRRLSAELAASGVFESIVDDASVIVSELLSNALRHARPLPSGQVRLTWVRTGELLELAVSDGGAMTEPRRGPGTLSSLGGRGLGIVEALCEGWGVRHDDGSTTVWAVLRAPKTVGTQVQSPSESDILARFGDLEDMIGGDITDATGRDLPGDDVYEGDWRQASTRAYPA
jgi:anti-sigma regulatory factor (Ser/Thr protein kinase)